MNSKTKQALFEAILARFPDVRVRVSDKFDGGTYGAGVIKLETKDPVMLAHELGHHRDMSGTLSSMRLHNILGGLSNLIGSDRLARYATYLKEKAAVENGLEILKEVAADEDTQRYAADDGYSYIDQIRNADLKYWPEYWKDPKFKNKARRNKP